MSFDERDYARRRAEQRQQSSWYKLKEGDNTFRILPTPPTKTVRTNFFEYAVHRDVGPKKQVVRCGIDPVTEEGECWLCDVKIPSLRKKKLESRALALAPKSQLLVQIAKVDDAGKMTGPFLFTPAKTIADQLLASIFGSRKRSYVDPAKGYNISINRTGTGKNDTRYGILEPDQEPSRVPQSLIEKLKPFEELKEVPAYSQAKQSAAYLGQDVVEEEEEEAPKSKTRKPAVEDDEEEDVPVADEDDVDVEDEDEDLDDEDDAPASKAKAKKKAVVEDDEDLDDEPAPTPKGKKKAAPVEDVEDDALEEEPELEPAPKAKSKAKSKVKAKAAEAEAEVEDDEDEDIPDDLDEDLDEEDESAPAPKPKTTAKGKATKNPEPENDPDDDIDLDEIEDEDVADEEDEPAPAPKAKSKVAARPKPRARR